MLSFQTLDPLKDADHGVDTDSAALYASDASVKPKSSLTEDNWLSAIDNFDTVSLKPSIVVREARINDTASSIDDVQQRIAEIKQALAELYSSSSSSASSEDTEDLSSSDEDRSPLHTDHRSRRRADERRSENLSQDFDSLCNTRQSVEGLHDVFGRERLGSTEVSSSEITGQKFAQGKGKYLGDAAVNLVDDTPKQRLSLTDSRCSDPRSSRCVTKHDSGKQSRDRLSGNRGSGDRVSGDRGSGDRGSGDKVSEDRSGDRGSRDRGSKDKRSKDRGGKEKIESERQSSKEQRRTDTSRGNESSSRTKPCHLRDDDHERLPNVVKQKVPEIQHGRSTQEKRSLHTANVPCRDELSKTFRGASLRDFSEDASRVRIAKHGHCVANVIHEPRNCWTAKYESLLTRHVNQVFIRGDNVVMVAIADVNKNINNNEDHDILLKSQSVN